MATEHQGLFFLYKAKMSDLMGSQIHTELPQS